MTNSNRGSAPSLFHYATTELSQDAMICWLLKWAERSEDPLGGVGKSFLGLFASKIPLKVDWSRIATVEVKRQCAKADVVAICRFHSEAPICIVIEDKIDAMLTAGDQLERNRCKVFEALKGTVPENRIFTFLFKSGYDYDCKLSEGCLKINYIEIKKWLNSISRVQLESSDVLMSWVIDQKRRIRKVEEFVSSARDLNRLSKAGGTDSVIDNQRDEIWSSGPFHYEFLRRLLHISGKPGQYHEGGNKREIGIYDKDRSGAFFLQQSHHGINKTHLWCNMDPFFYALEHRQRRWSLLLRCNRRQGRSIRRARQIAEQYRRALKREQIQAEAEVPKKSDPWPIVLNIDPGKSPGLPTFFRVHKAFRSRLGFREKLAT